ncbi:MAG: divergent polysaccharide deacetylase family protein [Rhizomicrobium sp.]
MAAAALTISILGKVHHPVVEMRLSPLFQSTATEKQSGRTRNASPGAASGLAPIDKPVFEGRALVADPALIENTPEGPLPRIADDGRRPMTAYAAPAASGKFRIAIVVSGLGLSARATGLALKDLPPGVTLAFAPYAGDVQHWVSQARGLGHEALLELPMEPLDYPDSDPGPNTLRSGVEQDGNPARLDWALSRITGYAGVTSFLGQHFLGDEDALAPILVQLARRGVYFFDNGQAQQSVAADVAARAGTAFAKASETLDNVQSATEIDARLSDLEGEARAHGAAIGAGFLYPVTVERIALWAKTLAGRGFVLVPVSAIVTLRNSVEEPVRRTRAAPRPSTP